MNQKEYELIGRVFAKRRRELKSVSDCTTIDEKDESRIKINRSFSEWHILLNDTANALEEEYSNFDRPRFMQIGMRGIEA